MPKVAVELSDLAVRKLRHGSVQGDPKVKSRKADVGTPSIAYHAVGGVSGLLLVCKPPVDGRDIGARSWILRTKVGDKRRDIGLGGYPDVTLTQARQRAREKKDMIRLGIDPVIDRKQKKSALMAARAKAVTFSDIAKEFIHKKSAEFKSTKQIYRLTQQLEVYAYPVLGQMVVGDIERAHVVEVLEPIWTDKHETANRLRLHIERVLDIAGAKGLRSGDNPARWKGNLDLTFPAGQKVANRQHHKALSVTHMPKFWKSLQELNTAGSKALQFGILTAARPGEVRKATWDQIDLKMQLWTVPANIMKEGREHKVPLSDAAVKLLKTMPKLSNSIFVGPRGRAITDVTVSKVPKLLGHDVTAHGFRATFRTWAQEHTAYAEEVCELALAHVNSDSTRAAYARGELLDKRRLLMTDWENFVLKGHEIRTATVVSIGGAK